MYVVMICSHHAGGTVRRTIEANWNKIQKKLCIVPSNKQDTLEEKISYVLQNLKEDQHIQDARHHLIAVVTEIVGHEYHKEILELIEGVELRVRAHVPFGNVFCRYMNLPMITTVHFKNY